MRNIFTTFLVLTSISLCAVAQETSFTEQVGAGSELYFNKGDTKMRLTVDGEVAKTLFTGLEVQPIFHFGPIHELRTGKGIQCMKIQGGALGLGNFEYYCNIEVNNIKDGTLGEFKPFRP